MADSVCDYGLEHETHIGNLSRVNVIVSNIQNASITKAVYVERKDE